MSAATDATQESRRLGRLPEREADDVKVGDMTPCECGHAREDHKEIGVTEIGSGVASAVIRGECEADGCNCSRYTPETDVPP